MSVINMKQMKNKKLGFTLIELLVVMCIMGILTVIGLANFRNAQVKARDAQRKSDLNQIKKALEMYYNDYGSYPSSEVALGGKIKIVSTTFDWKTNTTIGAELKDANTTYIKELPGDPSSSQQYCYKSSGPSFQLYATLENTQDPQCITTNCPLNRSCGGNTYNYGISSSNATP